MKSKNVQDDSLALQRYKTDILIHPGNGFLKENADQTNTQTRALIKAKSESKFSQKKAPEQDPHTQKVGFSKSSDKNLDQNFFLQKRERFSLKSEFDIYDLNSPADPFNKPNMTSLPRAPKKDPTPDTSARKSSSFFKKIKGWFKRVGLVVPEFV